MTEERNNVLRVKVLVQQGEVEVKRTLIENGTKALKPMEDYEGLKLRILGVPFGGPIEGRDAEGEAFYDKTDIGLNIGDERPLTYYHSFGPDDPWDIQMPPVFIGRAKYVEVDDRGHWFEATMDEGEELGMRIVKAFEDGTPVRASSGAVGHLVRMGKAGLIDTWPVGELAIFDTNEWRLPANDYAVVSLAKALAVETEETAQVDETKAVAALETEAVAIKSVSNIYNSEENVMDENENVQETPTQGLDLEALKGEIVSAAAEAAKAAVAELANAPAKNAGGIVMPTFTIRRPENDVNANYLHYLRTGEVKGLVGSTAASGGYLVPDDFLGDIIAKRDELAVARRAGARVVRTSRDVINVPVENVSLSDWSIVTQAGDITAASGNPDFDQAAVTIYKFTKLIKVSEELLEDEAAGLDEFLNDALARSWAGTENTYFLGGTGSNQPEGAITSGCLGKTLLSASGTSFVISASEVAETLYSMPEYYRQGAVWVMRNSVEGHIRSKTGDQFQFGPNPLQGGAFTSQLFGLPVYNAQASGSMGSASGKVLNVMNFAAGYIIAEHTGGLRVRRLTEAFAENGQVGILATFRVGGRVALQEAFYHARVP